MSERICEVFVLSCKTRFGHGGFFFFFVEVIELLRHKQDPC